MKSDVATQASALPLAQERDPRWITLRSVILGSLGVCLVCWLVPYNDYVVANAYLVGNYLPVVIVVTFFALAVLVNGPLHRLAPALALRSGEMAVVMAMMLAACAIPSQGLMRSFLPLLVAPFRCGSEDWTFWNIFLSLNLPEWLFPVGRIKDGIYSPIMADFYARVQDGQAIPYRAWILPLAGWGVFIAGMFSVLLSLSLLLRKQWAQNERLPFPIAQLQSALIQPPRPGRMLNDLLGNGLFWIALGAVFFIQSTVALNKYFPTYVPAIPTSYNFYTLFSEPPWSYAGHCVKTAKIYFTFIGLTYFIQGRTAFSLWAIYLIMESLSMTARYRWEYEITYAAWMDEHLGSAVAMVLGFLWVGRHQWWAILRQTFTRQRDGEALDEWTSPRTAVFGFVGGLAVMYAWLAYLHVQPLMCLGIIGMIVLSHVVTARVVAETGLPSVRTQTTLGQIYTNFAPSALTGRDVFFGCVSTIIGPFTTRESLLTFSMHGEQVVQSTGPTRGQRRGILALMVWSVLLGFAVCSFSSLRAYYSYAYPLSTHGGHILNNHGLENLPRNDMVTPMKRWGDGQWDAKRHDPKAHMAIGFVVTALLQAASLRWSSWPLMPVGYLVWCVWLFQVAWFSVFLGWLAKVLVVRFGGSKLYVQLRPLFVGLIFGEGLAMGAILVTNLILASLGYDYEVVNFMPT